MQQFLFQYLELFSFIGPGPPENPGGDFNMNCWIEAADRSAALEWGYVLLGDYYKARFTGSADAHLHDGSPIRKGEIIEDLETIAAAEHWNIRSCRIGDIPEWREPWRHSNMQGKNKGVGKREE